jgi:hypothetical protein
MKHLKWNGGFDKGFFKDFEDIFNIIEAFLK